MTRRLSLRRRRAADPVPGAEPPATAPDAEPATPPAPVVTAVHPAVVAPSEAAVPPADTPDGPSFRDRSRLRRRLRYLRRVRELGFRDLGGLVFDLHRFGREGSALVAGKLGALAAVDAELRALETVLDDREEYVILREPGIAACVRCAALHGSDAHFCPNCGLRLDGPQAIAEVAPAVALAVSAPGSGPDATPPEPAGVVEPAPGAVGQPVTTQHAVEPDPEPGPDPVEQPTTTQPAVEPGADPGRSTPAP